MNLKTLGLLAVLIVLLFFTISVLADVKAERIKISLDEQCIEKVLEVAETVEGVIQTHWDEETGELEIVFEDDKTDLIKIEKALSEAGFKTPGFMDRGEVSGSLTPDCGHPENM